MEFMVYETLKRRWEIWAGATAGTAALLLLGVPREVLHPEQRFHLVTRFVLPVDFGLPNRRPLAQHVVLVLSAKGQRVAAALAGRRSARRTSVGLLLRRACLIIHRHMSGGTPEAARCSSSCSDRAACVTSALQVNYLMSAPRVSHVMSAARVTHCQLCELTM